MFESEERRIVEKIKEYIKNENSSGIMYIMLSNGRILDIDDYRDMVSHGKINSRDAYVYIDIRFAPSKAAFYYPLLGWYGDFLDAYLLKLGFYNFEYYRAPATGLKYVALVVSYKGYLSIEVSNLDTAVNNLNLPKIVFEVLGGKIISGEKELAKDEYGKIYDMFVSQQLFAGYSAYKSWDIINEYYNKGNQSLAKEVARIAMDYYRIFNPYRVCYDMKTWKEVDCWSIKL